MKFFVYLCCLFLATNTMILLESNDTEAIPGLDVQLISAQEREEKANAVGLKIIDNQKKDENFYRFAVDETDAGYIYLGFAYDQIDVYSSDEIYQYTIFFQNNGAYDIFCYEGRLHLTIARGEYLVSIDKKGNIVDVFEFRSGRSSSSENSKFFLNLFHMEKFVVGDKIYELGNNSVITSKANPLHAYVEVTDKDGNSHYMYYSSESKFWTIRIGIVFIIIFAFYISVKNAIEKKREAEQKAV